MRNECFLRVETDASGDKEGIELLDAVEVILAEGMDGVVVEVEGLFFPWLRHGCCCLMLLGDVQQRPAHLIDKMVGVV